MPDLRTLERFPRLQITSDGEVIGPSGRTLSGTVDRDGYLVIHTYESGAHHYLRISRLVCEAFHGPPPSGSEAAHNDGDPGNNRPDNLRWATPVENAADKDRHGRHAKGQASVLARLTDDQVQEIRARRSSGESGRALAAQFGVTPSQICHIHKRRSWAHLP